MNPLTNIRNVVKLNENELKHGIFDHKKSWHSQYSDSAYIFIGGLPYDLSEGDILCVFSQYGEIVNINLVRDKKTGKSKGYAFICYEDQRSTILAVDNLNSIKLGGRTIRVDHVGEYRVPKSDEKDEDGKFKDKKETGCAPKTPSPLPSEDEMLDYEAEKKKKKKKMKKKEKKKKKEKEKDPKNYSSSDKEKDKNSKNTNNSGCDQSDSKMYNRSRDRSPVERNEKYDRFSGIKDQINEYQDRIPGIPYTDHKRSRRSISPAYKHRKHSSERYRKTSPSAEYRRNELNRSDYKRKHESRYEYKESRRDGRR